MGVCDTFQYIPNILHHTVAVVRSPGNRELLSVYMPIFRTDGDLHGFCKSPEQSETMRHFIHMLEHDYIYIAESIILQQNMTFAAGRRVCHMLSTITDC